MKSAVHDFEGDQTYSEKPGVTISPLPLPAKPFWRWPLAAVKVLPGTRKPILVA